MNPSILLFALLPSLLPAPAIEDLREAYDVEAYELELAVRPAEKLLEGSVAIVADSRKEQLREVQLDLYALHEVLRVTDGTGRELAFERKDASLLARLAEPVAEGTRFTVRVRYRGEPKGRGFNGFHWEESADGRPWIGTSCQGVGAHYWYPCKASYFHPEDKPARVSMAITCPADLVGVSNGRLARVTSGAPEWFDAGEEDWRTFHWRHDYPLETYSVTLNVGPYVVVESELELPGLAEPVDFIYWVLPENAEKAALQFRDVPELVRIFSEAFGPFPFPESKFGLVETSFWGMEHSTAVAYGSSYPAWCEQHDERDRYAARNRWFDFILVHEVAHEWWGNAISAEHWGHFWIHEGFGTYAEGVFVERKYGREEADRYFAVQARGIPATKGRLYRGDRPTGSEAYTNLIYTKGACVLNTLRHYLDDDEVWWRTLREFNVANRYGNVTTEDFRSVLEQNSGRDWERFFREWIYGVGTPSLEGEVRVEGRRIVVEVENGNGEFLVPLDLSWAEGGERLSRRVWIEPGERRVEIECQAEPVGLSVDHLDRVLGKHQVRSCAGQRR